MRGTLSGFGPHSDPSPEVLVVPFLLLAPLLLGPQAPEPSGEPVVVASTITEVTVYPGSATVRRRAELPTPGGRFVLGGLPAGLDPEALRVRTAGAAPAEVVAVELRWRYLETAPDPRIEELRLLVDEVELDLAGLRARRAVQERLRDHLNRLASPQHLAEHDGAPGVERWEQSFSFLRERMTAARAELRAIERDERKLQLRLEDLRGQIGAAAAGEGVWTYDLYVDTFAVASRGGASSAAQLEVDYVMPNASWTPVYDVRAAEDLASCALTYRARIQQETGEDWNDVTLFLSTAEPRRGAQGPEPEARWVGVVEPMPKRGRILADMAAPAAAAELSFSVEPELAALAFSPPVFAAVEDEGLSLRYRLPSRETVRSAPDAATVLVGRARLSFTPERYCIPALDPTVWVRGEARNVSEFVLLPGRAAIYLGADFLGHADLPLVQRDEEFSLPLGVDPAVGVERVQLEDEAGRTRSRRTERKTWRVTLKNFGARTARAGGAVEVIVHEALPRTADDRIEVDLVRVKPKLSTAERWKELRKEQGALTWVVTVPRSGQAVIEHGLDIEYPKDEQITEEVR